MFGNRKMKKSEVRNFFHPNKGPLPHSEGPRTNDVHQENSSGVGIFACVHTPLVVIRHGNPYKYLYIHIWKWRADVCRSLLDLLVHTYSWLNVAACAQVRIRKGGVIRQQPQKRAFPQSHLISSFDAQLRKLLAWPIEYERRCCLWSFWDRSYSTCTY